MCWTRWPANSRLRLSLPWVLHSQPVNKPATYTLAGVAAAALSLWQLWPAFDAIIFTQAEAADVAQVQRQLNYEDRRDIAELRLKHEVEQIEIDKLRAEIEYYTLKILELRELEK